MSKLDPQPENDDPALREAIRRAFGRESAPGALRQRVSALSGADAGSSRSSVVHRWRRPLAAMAAVLVIGLGIAYVMLGRSEEKVPQWFALEMVKTHDQCAALADHHLVADAATDANPAELGTLLEQRIGHHVPMLMLKDGWKFTGGGVCTVGSVPAAHLLFTRGNDAVSIFSISSNVLYPGSDSAGKRNYAQTEQGHQIAGFISGGAVHCVVTSSTTNDLSLRDAIRMREELRAIP